MLMCTPGNTVDKSNNSQKSELEPLPMSLFLEERRCRNESDHTAFLAVTTYPHENMPLANDLLHPSPEEEKRKHKKKCLMQSPNSYLMDVKCPGCYKVNTVFSHAQTVVLCVGCSTVLCQPTGGKARLTEGCSFRRKQH
nr:40S ribosomal protein S27-like [Macaca fascicularis]